MLAPQAVGGQELDLPDVVRREEALCEIDGSCGWVITLCADWSDTLYSGEQPPNRTAIFFLI